MAGDVHHKNPVVKGRKFHDIWCAGESSVCHGVALGYSVSDRRYATLYLVMGFIVYSISVSEGKTSVA